MLGLSESLALDCEHSKVKQERKKKLVAATKQLYKWAIHGLKFNIYAAMIKKMEKHTKYKKIY